MIDTIKKRLRSRGGFSLAELLMAILIVLMMTSVVTAGIPAASNAYYKVIDAANAQTLLSTTMTSLRNELSTAFIDEEKTGGTTITYTGSNGGETKIMYIDDETEGAGKGIYIKYSYDSSSRLLVSQAAANQTLYAAFGSIAYSSGIVTVTNLSVHKRDHDSDNALVTIPIFEIRVIT